MYLQLRMFYRGASVFICLIGFLFGDANENCKVACISRCQQSCYGSTSTPQRCLNTCPNACATACLTFANKVKPQYMLRTTTKMPLTNNGPLMPILDANIFQPIIDKYHEVTNYLVKQNVFNPSQFVNNNFNNPNNQVTSAAATNGMCSEQCLRSCIFNCDPNRNDHSSICTNLCRPFCAVRCGMLTANFSLFTKAACDGNCQPDCSTVCVIKEGLNSLFSASEFPKFQSQQIFNEINNHLNPNAQFVQEPSPHQQPQHHQQGDTSEVSKNTLQLCLTACVNRCARSHAMQGKHYAMQISKCHAPCENVCKSENKEKTQKKCDMLKCNQNCMYQCYALKNGNINCKAVCGRTCESMCIAPEIHSVTSHAQMMQKVTALHKIDKIKDNCLNSCSSYMPQNVASSGPSTNVCESTCISLDYERRRIMNTCSMSCQGNCKDQCLYSDKAFAQCSVVCKSSCDKECGNQASVFNKCEPSCLNICHNSKFKEQIEPYKLSIICYSLCRNEACNKY